MRGSAALTVRSDHRAAGNGLCFVLSSGWRRDFAQQSHLDQNRLMRQARVVYEKVRRCLCLGLPLPLPWPSAAVPLPFLALPLPFLELPLPVGAG